MKGNTVYLIFCRYTNGETLLQTLHATFDGAYNHMTQIREYWEKEKGFTVIPEDGSGGGFYVKGTNGFNRFYYVGNRTIDE